MRETLVWKILTKSYLNIASNNKIIQKTLKFSNKKKQKELNIN